MADDNSNSFSIPWAPLLAFLAAGSGILLLFPPPNSERPPSNDMKYNDTGYGEEEVDSRLWQDPLEAVEEWKANHPDTSENWSRLDRLRSRVEGLMEEKVDGNSTPDGGCVMILPVFLPAGPYAEEQETRLRDRIAVLDGLAFARFAPEDHEHIGYLDLPYDDEQKIATSLTSGTSPSLETFWIQPSPARTRVDLYRWGREPRPIWQALLDSYPGGATAPALEPGSDRQTSPSVVIPYEWWRSTDVGQTKIRGKCKKYILVLWINDYAFTRHPFKQIANLLSWFQTKNRTGTTVTMPDVAILGPQSSDGLKAMVDEVQQDEAGMADVRQKLATTRIYSCGAMAADSLLTGGTETCGHLFERKLWPTSPDKMTVQRHFLRPAITDDKLVDAMAVELERRGVRLAAETPAEYDLYGANPGPPDKIAIVSECDSFYARSLTQSFIQRIAPLQTGSSSGMWSADLGNQLVLPFAYFRGIDGKLPTDSTNEAAAGGNTNTQGGSQDAAGSQENNKQGASGGKASSIGPEGTNQTDYLERMVEEIVDTDKQLKNKGQYLKAVGVLGSDVYDKLEILEALRPRLRGTIFFTNQLDARYSVTSEWEFTRNLLVFSNYGLALDGKYRGSFAPFRDGYQTSFYEATLEATDQIDQNVETASRCAQVYEIGRSGPLSISGSNDSLSGSPPPLDDILSGKVGIFPRIWWFILAAVAAIGLCCLAELITGQNARIEQRGKDGENGVETKKMAWLSNMQFALCTLGIGLLVLAWCWFNGKSTLRFEPVSFLEGISVWPSVAIQHLAILLSLVFMWKAQSDLKENALRISRKFGLPFLGDRASKDENSPEPPESPVPPEPSAPIVTPKDAPERDWRESAAKRCESLKTLLKTVWHSFTWSLEPGKNQTSMKELWIAYQQRGNAANRLIRTSAMTLLYMAMIRMLQKAIGGSPGHPPGRVASEHLLPFWEILFPVSLAFFVIDATRLHTEFVRRCRRAPTQWPEETFKEYKYFRGMGRENIALYLDIRLIAKRTDEVNTLIYYPFIIFSLWILSQIDYLDAFSHPIGNIVAQILYLALALYSAYTLPKVAREYRDETVKRLTHSLNSLELNESPRLKQKKLLQQVIERIKSLDEGAFVSLWDQPAARAILLPSGGIGLWTLLQYLPKG